LNTLKNPSRIEASFLKRGLCGWVPFWIYSALVFEGAILPASEIPEFLHRYNDKFLHFSEFFLLFLISENAFRMAKQRLSGHPGMMAYGYCILMGVITEMAQHFAKGRTPEFYDFIADAAGAGLSFALYGFIKLQYYRRLYAARRSG